MATTQPNVRAGRTGGARAAGDGKNSRRNEIIAIALFAVSALFALSLASYHPNDPSWNGAGQSDLRNLVGAVGANISALLFQTVGLAAYLVPLLLIAAAWRRFRTRRIYAPLSRVIGLLTLVFSVAALLALSGIAPIFDASVNPGGLAGTIVATTLASGLNTVGASVLLIAAAATGLLLATNFSFAHAYDQLAAYASGHLSIIETARGKFEAWRAARRAAAEARQRARQQARAEQQQAVETAHALKDKTSAERVAEFMRATEIGAASATASSIAPINRAIKRSAAATESTAIPASAPSYDEDDYDAEETIDDFELPSPVTNKAKRVGTPKQNDDSEEIAAMLEDVSVIRTEVVDEASAPTVRYDTAKQKSLPGHGAKGVSNLSDYKLPAMDFMNAPPPHREQADAELLGLATRLAEKCKEFNVTGQIKHICPGPVVTTYEFKPDPGVKYSRVTNLVDDLCLALKAESIRIDRLPGKSHVGIEVPNTERETIFLREVIESRLFQESPSKLTIALGKTIDGLNYVADLAKMPHLLIAGSTGAGKSVCVNSLVVSILYKAQPDEVKFIMVDPKRLELGLYADIPHLATPIITDPKRASHALKWAVSEMERRYKDLAGWGVRNIDGYNTEIARRNFAQDYDESGAPWKPLPYIVIIIDELADLMMVSGHEVEESITRLAQMARAVGIHLVLATQRPSVDVITGLIKANFPSRISFRVSSKVDSRTIIDANGAESLLGRGDMLFLPPGTSRLIRVHGAFIDETEVGRIVGHVKAQTVPNYDITITQSEEEATGGDGAGGTRDELFEEALRICVEMKRASTSVLQRRLRIGYGRAAAMLDAMEREGFIGQADGARPRAVLGRAFETVAHWDEMANN